jgi:hypothetical protein
MSATQAIAHLRELHQIVALHRASMLDKELALQDALPALLACAEALEAQLVWHKERDKALSKQPPGPDVNWRRMEHREQIDAIRAALEALGKVGGE